MSTDTLLTYSHFKEFGEERVEVYSDGALVGEHRAIAGWWKFFPTDGAPGELCASLQESKDKQTDI